MSARGLLSLIVFVFAGLARADGPADNEAEKVRQVPPKGIVVPEQDRLELQSGLDRLRGDIDGLRTTLKGRPELLSLLPDVQIYYIAIHTALTHDEFFKTGEIATGKKLIQQGLERAAQLREGKAPWNTATGLVVRGYVSRIDGSVQPYGLVVPASYAPDTSRQFRLDVWCHGRRRKPQRAQFHRWPPKIRGRVHTA